MSSGGQRLRESLERDAKPRDLVVYPSIIGDVLCASVIVYCARGLF